MMITRLSSLTRTLDFDEYFDPYVREDGSWDYDMLSSHRAVIDNIDKIVSAAYRQGMGDGQRGIVDKAANVKLRHRRSDNKTKMQTLSFPN